MSTVGCTCSLLFPKFTMASHFSSYFSISRFHIVPSFVSVVLSCACATNSIWKGTKGLLSLEMHFQCTLCDLPQPVFPVQLLQFKPNFMLQITNSFCIQSTRHQNPKTLMLRTECFQKCSNVIFPPIDFANFGLVNIH